MKINIILPAIGHSGGIDVIYKYTQLLIEEGHDVLVYKEIKASNMHRYNSKIKNFIHRCYCSCKAISASRNPKTCDKFVWSINNLTIRDADVVIATSWPTAFTIIDLTSSKGKKFYFIQDFEIWDNKKLGLESYMLPLNKIVISTWINNQLKEHLNIGPFPVVMNGIELVKFHSRTTVNYKKDDIIQFLMLNHTLEKKGVKCGIEAYERIHKLYPNTRLKMFGMCSGDNLPEYVEYIQNPPQGKLVELYCESDIFLFPSLEEGWGLTPIEAMACGCAVVGTNTGFVLDLGKHQENMMISEPGDVDFLFQNIKILIDDNDLIVKIKDNGNKIVQQLNWTESSKILFEILKESQRKRSL